jgi:uncharacterized protein (TIRG00374 family)
MKSASKMLFSIGRVALGICLLCYVLFRRDNGIDPGLFRGAWWLLIVLPLLALLGGFVEAFRLRLLCRSQQTELGMWYALRLVLVSLFFNFFVPGGTGGDVAKMYYLAADSPGRGMELAVVVFVDRIAGMLGLIITVFLLALVNITLVSDYPLIRWLLGALAVVLAAVVGAAFLFYSGVVGKRSVPNRFTAWLTLRQYVGRATDAVNAFRFHKLALLMAVVVSILGNSLIIIMFLLSGAVFMPDSPAAVVSFLTVLGMFANALPLTPGGLGVGEAAFEGLFGLVGISYGAMLMVSWRLGVLPLGLLGGLIYITGAGRRAAPNAQ